MKSININWPTVALVSILLATVLLVLRPDIFDKLIVGTIKIIDGVKRLP